MSGRKRLLTAVAVSLASLVAGCEGDATPTAPPGVELDFSLEVPERILAKRVVAVTARLTRARGVTFPLTFVFEKQNRGEPAFVEASRSIDESFEGEITVRFAARMDPLVRVTVSEARPGGVTVTKSSRIDVLTFR